MTENRAIRHFHLLCGLGGGALVFNRDHTRVENTEAKFKFLGGIDDLGREANCYR